MPDFADKERLNERKGGKYNEGKPEKMQQKGKVCDGSIDVYDMDRFVGACICV